MNRTLGVVKDTFQRLKEFIAPSQAIEENELLEQIALSDHVKEMIRQPGFKYLQEMCLYEKDGIIQRLKYDAKIDIQDRIMLQGQLKGIEAFHKAIETALTAGENAQRLLEERRKEQS